MVISKIRVKNFKNFRDLTVDLGNLNVLIGANASGKSNFIRIFEFLRDINNHGLDNAISMQGGVEYLRNINIGASDEFSMEVVFEHNYRRVIRKTEKEFLGMRVNKAIYTFALKFKQKGMGFEVASDRLVLKCKFFRLAEQKKKIVEKESLGEGEIGISNIKGKVNIDSKISNGLEIKKDDIIPPFLEEKLPQKTLLLEEMPYIFTAPLARDLGDIMIYDFDPKRSKKAVTITGKTELEENGQNIAIVLKSILRDKEKERKLSNLIKDLLPFVSKLGIDKFADKSLLFKIEEIYAQKHFLPAPLISDGTINMSALVIALYFEDKPLTIIEEPERNIHPFLIPNIVEMMKEASQVKQIIVTTHNPEFVKCVDIESLMLISRDKEGFSNISRPAEKEEIKIFLKNDIGIEELYVQNLLGA